MTEPLSLDTLLAEFDEAAEAWVLRDSRSGKYVTIPHERYPGRIILHFFMSRDTKADAEAALEDAKVKRRNGVEPFPSTLTVEEVIDRYLEHGTREVTVTTLNRYREVWRARQANARSAAGRQTAEGARDGALRQARRNAERTYGAETASRASSRLQVGGRAGSAGGESLCFDCCAEGDADRGTRAHPGRS